ncbi:MAG: thioredoxin-dependent thiol peroxidase [Nanoarchaeota archaeon]|nr:thioredoxin-dependent thiol peroxidase [Nanoarchaeota archaeon]
MKELKEGGKAPDFKLRSTKGKTRTLKDYKNKTLVLYFYPRDNTPGCTKEACSLRDGYGKLRKKGIEILGVSPDSEESHKKFTDKHKLPFELLVDSDKGLAKKYRVYGEKKFMGRTFLGIIRTTFIIEKGKIKHILKKVDVGNHAEQILDLIKK